MIILASSSPRRKKLMEEEISPSFIIEVPFIDEGVSFKSHENVEEIVEDIALRKCLEIAKNRPTDLVISADTVVVVDGQIIGKPKDEEDAYHMLKQLSGKNHDVYTGYAIKREQELVQGVVKSTVTFNKLSDELIRAYIASGSPLDKAGAYGLQDNDKFPLVKKISGSINNVIGFPTDEIKEDLIKYFGF